MGTSSESKTFYLLVGAAVILAGYYFIYYTGNILLPFFLSVVAAYLVNPFIAFFEARGVRRDYLVPGFYLIALAFLVLAAHIIVPWAIETAAVQKAKIPEIQSMLRHLPDTLQKEAVKRLPFGGDLAANAIRNGQTHLVGAFQSLPGVLLGLMPVLLGLLLVPFVMYFVLLQGPGIIQGFLKICPDRHVEKVLSLVCQVDDVLGNYLRGLLVEAIGVSMITWAGLTFLGVRYPVEIGIVSGVTNMIPYLGPVCGGVVGIAVAFFQFNQMLMVIKVAVLFGLVQLVDNWILQPLIMRQAVEIHPVLLVFSLLAGGQLFGFFGLLFAVPFVCILKEAGEVVYDWYIAEVGRKKTSFSHHALRIPYL